MNSMLAPLAEPGTAPATALPAALPARRADLVIRPTGDDGAHVIKDPRAGAYYRLGPEESFLLIGLDGRATADALAAAFERRFGQPLPAEDLDGFLDLARQHAFLSDGQAGAAATPTGPGNSTPAPAVRPPIAGQAARAGQADSRPGAVRRTAPAGSTPAGSAPGAPGRATSARAAGPASASGAVRAQVSERAPATPSGEAARPGVRGTCPGPAPAATASPPALERARATPSAAPPAPAPAPAPQAAPAAPAARSAQSILSWRKSVYDPDRLFDRLEPWLRFVWTRTFLALSAAAIVAAGAVAWANRHEIVSGFTGAWDLRVVLLAWLVLALATTLHEFAHGLTCKHYGGEVHEVGFLLLFFMPCFYCNVSDAWLFRERWKRLGVTFAGGYWDLCLWAAAVFAWRLTAQETLPNYLAWLVLSVCGARIFFNLNPLLKLDGYYLLSDATGIPNLRQRGTDALAARVRWLLWGAARPAREPRGRFLLVFGALTWLYAIALLSLLAFALVRWANGRWGIAGAVAAGAVAAPVLAGLFRGFSSGEAATMLATRRARTAAWLLVGAGIVAALLTVPIADRASGPFEVRSATRTELRATVAGFLRALDVREGEAVAAGAMAARIEVPELSDRIVQKRTELAEARTRLAVAEAGPRTPSAETAREIRVRNAERALAEATVARVRAELALLEETDRRQRVHSPVGGLVVTPRLAEQVGRFVHEGDLICTVEGDACREVEVALPEQEAARVRPGQAVELKARALPFETLQGVVVRVGAAAAAPGGPAGTGGQPAPVTGPAQPPGAVPGTVTVYCRLEGAPAGLRPGMTGDARVTCDRRPVGRVLADRFLRYVRTEFWW